MEKSKTSNRYSPEMRARAVRMVLEHQGSYETQSAAVAAIAPKIGCIPETLRGWVRQAEKDSGARDGATSAERDRIKELEREVRQLRQANEILRIGETFSAIGPRTMSSAYFAQAELDRPFKP
jgi:transposase